MDQRHHLDQLQFLMHEVPHLMREDIEMGTSHLLTQRREQQRPGPDPLDGSCEFVGEPLDLRGRLNGVPVLRTHHVALRISANVYRVRQRGRRSRRLS